MKLIVGLGNPGLRYADTRHNIGFKAVKLLAKKYSIKINKKESGAKTGAGIIAGHKVILALPHRFMNLSGEPVKSFIDYYKIKHEDLLVVCDDINILLGSLRIRQQGSAGGHNGLKSIIENMGTDAFARLRIGVGVEGLEGDMTGFVLGSFTREQAKVLPCILSGAVSKCEDWLNRKAD